MDLRVRTPTSIQVFAAASDAPRVHRVNDLVAALTSAALLFVLALVAADGPGFDGDWSALAAGLPGWVLWSAQAVLVAAVAYTGSLVVGVGLFARDRLELVRDLLLAALLAAAFGIALGQIVDSRWPEVSLVVTGSPATTFPAFFVASVTAIQAAAGPHLSAPVRHVGWGAVGAGVVGSLVGNVAQPSDVVAALLVGLVAAATVRLALGTTAGLPSIDRVASGLADIGIEVVGLAYTDEQPIGSATLTGTVAGTPARVRVLGRDAWEARRWAQMWRFAWYQEDGPQQGHSRREQVEHEALALLIAQRAGVNVSELIGVGLTAQEDAVVVAEQPDRPLLGLGDAVDDDLLVAVWQQVELLHGSGISHGNLNATSVGLDPLGNPVLVDFSKASMHATDQQINEDIVELLVSTVLMVGPDRALPPARAVIGPDAIVAALPMMASAALGPSLRWATRRHQLKVGDLRKQVAADLGVDPPAVEQLKRVDPTKALLAVVGVFAAYTIISGLADVGFDTIAASVKTASVPTLLLALIVVQSTNVTDAVSLVAISPKPVPVGLATMEQSAISFVNIAVPSAAGRLALNVRFFQKFGVSAVTSSSSSVIAGFIGFLGQVVLLTLAVVVGKRSVDLSGLQAGGGAVELVGLVVVIVLIGVIVVLAVPTLRRRVVDRLRSPFGQLQEALVAVRQPRNFIRSLAGAMGSEILYALGIVLCVQALGGELQLGEAIFINIVVSLFAGLSPVPGGIGIAEAGLAAGLTGVGVPSDTAVAAVLLYRMCSYYLPPVWGWFSMQWLKKHEYL